MTRLFLSLLLAVFFYSLSAQTPSSRLSSYKNFVAVSNDYTKDNFFEEHDRFMGLTAHDEMRLFSEATGMKDYRHYRYMQYHSGIEVYGVGYILHEREGIVVSANGSYLPGIDIDVRPSVTPEEALIYAMGDMDAEVYGWQAGKDQQIVSADFPEVELVIIDQGMPLYSGVYLLCYRIKLYSSDPIGGEEYLIDAQTGTIVNRFPLIHQHGVPGKGESRYYGEVNFLVDSIAPESYKLHDDSRGINGITVRAPEVDTFRSETSHFDFSDEAAHGHDVAVDAYYCTGKCYDMFRDKLSWLGIDDRNGSMNIGVRANDQDDFVNAFWNGFMAWIGNGDCNRGPLTTFEVISHEFMHGVTQHSSGLIYSGESGAINESMSDVIGKLAEYYYDPNNFSWEVGHSFVLKEGIESFRDMANPLSKDDPAYYGGENWFPSGGVHTNSAIGNLWYHYLSVGGNGTNEGGYTFDVEGIGIEEAAKFAFYVNRNYLVANSTYNDYYYASLQAAEEYFDGDPDIMASITEAWRAVGLPTILQGEEILDLGLSTLRFVDICGREIGTYVPLEFSISNSGNVDYRPDMNGAVRINFFNDQESINEVIELDDTIAIGESLSFVIDSLLLLTGDNFIFVNYGIELMGDAVEANDDLFSFYRISYHEANDLSINVNSVDDICFTDMYDFSFRLDNESCTDFPAGSSLPLVIREEFTGTVVFSGQLETPRVIGAGQSINLDTTLVLSLSETSPLEFLLDFSDDPNPENNADIMEVTVLGEIDESYENRFSDFSELNGDLYVRTNDMVDEIFQWNGESYFLTTGTFDELSPEYLCFDSNRNWEKDIDDFTGSISAQIETCVDLSQSNNPELRFDLGQWRNNSLVEILESSALRVSWTGTEAGYQDFVGLPEGMVLPQSITLPSNFKGQLEFKFLTNSGIEGAILPWLLDFDVMMMDNLRFVNEVSTSEALNSEDILLYPNPATTKIYVTSILRSVSYQISDISGRIVLSGLTEKSIDVSELNSGYYVVSLRGLDEVQKTIRFVKM